ncbi:MAG: SpoIVB peptidase [Christensenellales bacterium]
MKKTFKILLIVCLFFLYAYVYNIAAIPQNIILSEGEKINFKLALGLGLQNSDDYEATWVSSNLNKSKVGNNKVELKLFNSIAVKDINVSVIPTTTVIPVGKAIGMKLYTKGVLVVGMSEIENEERIKEKPYENSGIEEGDSIIAINNEEINTTDELIQQVNNSNGESLKIKYVKDDKILETSIVPVKTKEDYKIGLWVRDAAAGIGTLTFYEPSTNMFMSLGHGIIDIDTEEIVDISRGELVTANILSIIKGEKNKPGEIKGSITKGVAIGDIYKNTKMGVYGNVKNRQYIDTTYNEMEVAERSEIKTGKATILCQLDSGAPQEYQIEIERIYLNNNTDNKSMLIKITDEELLNKTGGIIQGMSGAPIMQNGKFIGAVTNVLVKDPTKGYAIFGDLLIKQMRSSN